MGRVTEKLRVKIDHGCTEQPIYLNWLGTSGGRNYWLFRTRQAYGLNTAVTGTFKPYLPDIENAQGTTYDTGRDASPRLTLGASLDIEDARGLDTLLYSPNVLMLANPETWESEGPKWQVVRVVPGSYKLRETDQTRAEVELTIELCEIFIQGT